MTDVLFRPLFQVRLTFDISQSYPGRMITHEQGLCSLSVTSWRGCEWDTQIIKWEMKHGEILRVPPVTALPFHNFITWGRGMQKAVKESWPIASAGPAFRIPWVLSLGSSWTIAVIFRRVFSGWVTVEGIVDVFSHVVYLKLGNSVCSVSFRWTLRILLHVTAPSLDGGRGSTVCRWHSHTWA